MNWSKVDQYHRIDSLERNAKGVKMPQLLKFRQKSGSNIQLNSVFLSIVSLFLALNIGCDDFQPSTTPMEAATHRPKDIDGYIAVVGACEDDPLWKIIRATAQRYHGSIPSFELKTAAPKTCSANEQIRILESLKSPRLRGLCIQPADTPAMNRFLDELRIDGVPVVTMVNRLETETPYMSVSLDEIAVGRLMADSIAKAVNDKGTIALIHGNQTVRRTADRYVGFKERIRQIPSVTVLKEMNCDNNAFVSVRLIHDYLERFPRLNGVVSVGDWPLQEAKAGTKLLPETCKMVTYGPFPKQWLRITDGTCYALIGADYAEIVEKAMKMCLATAQGEVVEIKYVLVDPVVVNGKNIDEYRQSWIKASTAPESHPAKQNN